MKTIVHDGSRFLLRLDRGEELLASLERFTKDTEIRSATFSAIGSATEAILSWYNAAEKRYEDITIEDGLEIIGVSGNIGTLGSATAIHAHGLVGDRNFAVRGGHIKKLVTAATCEIDLTVIAGALERAPDEKTGLNLLQ